MPRVIKLNANGGPAEAQITIGQGNLARFAVYVFESDKTTHRTIADGVTPPSIQHGSMGASGALKGSFLVWDAVVVPIMSGDPFAVTIDVIQGGKTVNTFTDTGKFTGTTPQLVHGNASIDVV
jgi:hypothetical protein